MKSRVLQVLQTPLSVSIAVPQTQTISTPLGITKGLASANVPSSMMRFGSGFVSLMGQLYGY